jgi:rubredoxin
MSTMSTMSTMSRMSSALQPVTAACCLACGKSDSVVFFDLWTRVFFRCKPCGFIWVEDRPDATEPLTPRRQRATVRAAMQTRQREFWNGPPERLPGGFTVTRAKGDRVLTAVCQVYTHQMGWELRLQVDGQGLLMSSVVRSGAEMIAKVEEWQRAMLEKGWG